MASGANLGIPVIFWQGLHSTYDAQPDDSMAGAATLSPATTGWRVWRVWPDRLLSAARHAKGL